MAMPSAFAVLRLMISSNLVTCWVGRSAGFAPLPPGRLKLATRPPLTGSLPVANTIGIVAVACLAA